MIALSVFRRLALAGLLIAVWSVAPAGAQNPAAPAAGASARAARAASAAPRSMQAARRDGPIHLDGRLDEPAWAAAPASSNFTQSYPQPGAEAEDPTEVRIVYDDDAIYVGVRMFDRDAAGIAAPLARRDASGIYSDWLHVVIDAYHDRRNAARFSVNPRGVQKDVLHSDDRVEDLNWDAVWEVATSIDSLGWTAEYRIPYSQLRFPAAPPGDVRTWGLQVQRDVARRNERDSWSPWTRNSAGYVSSEGDVTGLRGIEAPQRLEVSPYVSSQVTRAPGSALDPFYHQTDARISAGADLKLGLPRGLTLTATLNPDFGQVEADPAVVNLSAFETFFPEQRPFFTEGANVFSNFGRLRVNSTYGSQQVFYSRRIGRAPQRSPRGIAYADVPAQTTILGAGKVTGKVGPWTVGLLDAVTARETAPVVLSDGSRDRQAVEPRTNYMLARTQRELHGGNTRVGGMFTATNRDLGDAVFTNLLRSRAMVGGVDFEQLWAQQRWALGGYLVGSEIDGSAPVIAAAQRSSSRYYGRPDASHLELDPARTSLRGYMGELALARSGNLYASLDLKQVSPGFEVNDLGFQGRVDYRSATVSAGYNSVTAGRRLRSWSTGGGVNNAWNLDGDHIWNSLFAYGGFTALNFWQFSLSTDYQPTVLSDRLTRGGPLASVPANWSASASVSSDTRKPVAVDGNVSYGSDAAGGWSTGAQAGIVLRPSSSVRVSIAPGVSRRLEMGQYVEQRQDAAATATYGTRYVFGELTQTTVSATTRVDWTFSPTLSLQVYAQPFAASGDFANFKSLSRPRSFEFDPYAGPLSYAPSFNRRSLRGNAVLRWQYRPGSALFFVWQQQRATDGPLGDFDAGRDGRGIFEGQPSNVFLVKASYWFAR